MSDLYKPLMGAVVVELFGKPMIVSATEWRFGNKGSLSVNPVDGIWHSHEEGKGGGVLDLITWKTSEQGKPWLIRNGFLSEDGQIKRQADVSQLLGRGEAVQVPAEYIYTDEHGDPRYKVRRYYKNGKRLWSQFHLDNGAWRSGLEGVDPLLYRLPELLANPTAPVFVVEGEKDVDRLRSLGLVATCNSGGGGKNKWKPELNHWLQGREVVIIPDNDETGREHGQRVFTELSSAAKSVVLQDLVKIWPDCPFKGDVSDFLDAGGDIEQLIAKPCDQSPAYIKQGKSPLALLKSLSANGKSEARRIKMLNDVHVLRGIALLGEWTTIYAESGTGKTLITLHLLSESISSGVIDGSNIYYANVDDNFKGATQKLKIAEEAGFNMLLEGENGFKSSELVSLMSDLSDADEAHGVVIILDTLKKFTDLMDKKLSTEFGKIARRFTELGGTVIALAHTNKHKNELGKSVYSGTSDIKNDCDCTYIVEKVGQNGDVHTVRFENDKDRGDVEKEVTFTYCKIKGASYFDILKSVERVSSAAEANAIQEQLAIQKQRENDEDVIDALSKLIREQMLTKTDLIKAAMDESGVSRKKVQDVLKRWEQKTPFEPHKIWRVVRGEKNASYYSLDLSIIHEGEGNLVDVFQTDREN